MNPPSFTVPVLVIILLIIILRLDKSPHPPLEQTATLHDAREEPARRVELGSPSSDGGAILGVPRSSGAREDRVHGRQG